MIEVFTSINGFIHLEEFDTTGDTSALENAIWINITKPTKEEIHWVESATQLSIPDITEVNELESSSHTSYHEDGLEVNSLFLQNRSDEIINTNVAMILNDQIIISLSHLEPQELKTLKRLTLNKKLKLNTPREILLEIFELKVDRLADTMENTYSRLGAISKPVLNGDEEDLEMVLSKLAKEDDIVGKVRLCIMDAQRDLHYLLKKKSQWNSEQLEVIQNLLSELTTLLPHNDFLSEKVDFLMNAALGFITIQQNKIIKIFSIAAVVFLPPTLVASIYGMNFKFMPELSWVFGYPFAITLMIVAGIMPYLYFKHKGWL